MVDLDARRDRLDDYLTTTGTDAIWFARPASFAWLTGERNVVDRGSPVGFAAAGYVGADGSVGGTGSGEFRVVTTRDADRYANDVLPGEFSVHEVAWYESSLGDAVAAHSPDRAVADFDVPGLDHVDLSPLRHPLTDDDVVRYRALAEESAAAVERVCRELGPGDTEHEVASALGITLSSGKMDAPTVLVSGSDRAERFGAAPPTGNELGDYAVVSVTTERAGLHASLTRTVAFDPPEWLHDRHRAAAKVEASALAATREAVVEGGTAGDVFEVIQRAYEAVGYPDVWRDAPQGGAAGFARREWTATPGAAEPVTAPRGYAWNPAIGGARSEDTYLVEDGFDDGEDGDVAGDGVECLTATPHWPTIRVEAPGYDVTLERHGILDP